MALTTFREIQRRVGQRIQNLDTSTTNPNDLLPKIKVWVNERYERILRSKPWEELTRKTTLQIVASQRAYSLPRNIGQIVKIFDATNARPIREITAHEYVRSNAIAFDQSGNILTGKPCEFYQIGKYTVKDETGSTAEQVSIVSTSTSDVSPLVIHIVGLSSGVEISEDVVITGQSSVDSVNTYDANQKLQISVGTNDGTTPSVNGTITVSGKTSGNVLTKISKFELVTEYPWIEVTPLPNTDTTQPLWNIWYRRQIEPLKSDNDIPMIDCVNELVYGAYSDALREDGQENEANVADQKWVSMVEELWASLQNPDRLDQFVPQDRDNSVFDEYYRSIQQY